jgi:hypothetical protein
MLDFIEFRAGQKQAMATYPPPSPKDLGANQREFHRFFELPRNMANPMEAIARATISIRSIIGLVFNHTRAFKSTDGLVERASQWLSVLLQRLVKREGQGGKGEAMPPDRSQLAS